MSYAPRILPVSRVHGFCPALPSALSASFELFVVVADGWFHDRRWRSGEVLVCEPTEVVQGTGAIVLEARGLGRPRVGIMENGRLRGDAGEPCSTARWRVSGRLMGVLRPARVGEHVHASTLAPEGWVLEATTQSETAAVAQLSLFSRAA